MQEINKDLEYDFRTLNIARQSKGAALLRKLYYGDCKVEELTKVQLEEIREVWNTRNFIPRRMWKCTECSKRNNGEECESCKKRKGFDNLFLIKPDHIPEESEEEYNRRYIKEIVELLKKL